MSAGVPPQADGDELPHGVVPLRPAPPPPGGCGLTGCLYGTVLLFALLLVVLLAYALARAWWSPPVLR